MFPLWKIAEKLSDAVYCSFIAQQITPQSKNDMEGEKLEEFDVEVLLDVGMGGRCVCILSAIRWL